MAAGAGRGNDTGGRAILVLTRRVGQRLFVGDRITVTVVQVDGDKVRIGIEAPRDIPIAREELGPARDTRAAARPDDDRFPTPYTPAPDGE